MLIAKYIAAGFMKDAESLLKDFIMKGTLDFQSFCAVWKNHNFSFIFLGRSDEKELREFINEMYQLTLNHMLPLSTEFQIGALYLLYALFRNQEIIKPVRIRVTLIQFRVIMHVWDYAQRKKIRSLQYIVEYLCANCLEFVACSSLFGPCGTKTKTDCSKTNMIDNSLLTDLKLNMSSFYENNVLEDLKSLHKIYLKTKERIMPCKEVSADIIDEYDKLNYNLENLLGLEKHKICKNEPGEDIGCRRIEIKSASFRKKAKYYRSQTDEEVAEEVMEEVSPTKRVKAKRKKRVPPELRKIGRPKKTEVVSEESEGEVTADSTPLHNTRKGPIGRKRVSYLKQYKGPLNLDKPRLRPRQNSEVYNTNNVSSEESSGDVKF